MSSVVVYLVECFCGAGQFYLHESGSRDPAWPFQREGQKKSTFQKATRCMGWRFPYLENGLPPNSFSRSYQRTTRQRLNEYDKLRHLTCYTLIPRDGYCLVAGARQFEITLTWAGRKAIPIPAIPFTPHAASCRPTLLHVGRQLLICEAIHVAVRRGLGFSGTLQHHSKLRRMEAKFWIWAYFGTSARSLYGPSASNMLCKLPLPRTAPPCLSF
jgi:hypothetical protein